MTNWRAALNFIVIDLAENQSYCLYNDRGMKKLIAHWRPVVKFWSPVQNFKSHWRPGKRNFGPCLILDITKEMTGLSICSGHKKVIIITRWS